MFVEDSRRSAALLRDACTRYRRMHEHVVEKIEQCAYELAWLAEERGDRAEASDVLRDMPDTASPEGAIAHGYRALLAGDYSAAIAMMTAFVADHRHDTFWPRWRVVDAQLVAALAADRANDRTRAIELAEGALAAVDSLGDFAATSFVQRRRGRLLAMLASWGVGDVTKRTAEALAWARRAGYAERIAAFRSSR